MNFRRPPALPEGYHTRTMLAIAALLALGACSDMQQVRDQANPGPYRPWSRADVDPAQPRVGTVQSIEVVRIAHSGGAAGAAAQSSDAYRVMVRMHDGSYQSLTQTTGAELQAGDRVQVANGVAQRF